MLGDKIVLVFFMHNFCQLPPTRPQQETALRCPCCGAAPTGTGGSSLKVSLKLAMLAFNVPMAIWAAASSEKLTVFDGTGLAIIFWVIGDVALAFAMLLARN
ncbi:hypothetical protein [Ruegeria atlantica]|uniref:hypothetical protein n=1 Tax=Ruegeria atlantica TaxID=81569 RepID=UPI00147FC4B2|nr:hypothetical protein [Ruegeria atlantica]